MARRGRGAGEARRKRDDVEHDRREIKSRPDLVVAVVGADQAGDRLFLALGPVFQFGVAPSLASAVESLA